MSDDTRITVTGRDGTVYEFDREQSGGLWYAHGATKDKDWWCPSYEAALLDAYVALRAELMTDRAVCICGCPNETHESYGEDGEACEHEDHECLRVPVAVRDMFVALRARVVELKVSMVRHFTEEHLAGDGPEIDRWKAKARTAEATAERLSAALKGLYRRKPHGTWNECRCCGCTWWDGEDEARRHYPNCEAFNALHPRAAVEAAPPAAAEPPAWHAALLRAVRMEAREQEEGSPRLGQAGKR